MIGDALEYIQDCEDLKQKIDSLEKKDGICNDIGS